MDRYFVNNEAQPTGEHEVHKAGCRALPSNRFDLGEYSKCENAVVAAKAIYPNSDGCKICIPECHTK